MFTQYADLILLMMTIIETLTIFLVIMLLNKVNRLERINKLLQSRETSIVTENVGWRTIIPKAIRVSTLNAEDIKSIKEQQALVNRWLGEVLNISNLIPAKEYGIEVSDIIEELRQRVKWQEEIERQQLNDSDFYKGD